MFYKDGHSTSKSALEKDWLSIRDFIAKIRFRNKGQLGYFDTFYKMTGADCKNILHSFYQK